MLKCLFCKINIAFSQVRSICYCNRIDTIFLYPLIISLIYKICIVAVNPSIYVSRIINLTFLGLALFTVFNISTFYCIVNKRVESMMSNFIRRSYISKTFIKRYSSVKMSVLGRHFLRLLFFPFTQIHKIPLYSAIPVSTEDSIP